MKNIYVRYITWHFHIFFDFNLRMSDIFRRSIYLDIYGNYQNFTEALKDVLKKNPVISFNDFKKNAQNLY